MSSASNTLVEVKVLFFAKTKELTGVKEADIKLPIQTNSQQILNLLLQQFESLSVISESVILSLNEEYLQINSDQILLKPTDELAVIPPISGG